MKIRCASATADGGYLQKSDAVWATCLTNAAVTGASLGDTTYAYIGKRLSGGTYYLWQTFCRFNLSAIPASGSIVSCTLRLYVHTDESDTDVTVRLKALDATYGTLDGTDWEAAGTYAATLSTATGISTDTDSVKYMDFEFTADMLTTLSTTSTAYDMRLEITNETAAPTGDEYLKCYSPNHATYRPYLTIIYDDGRERIIKALIAELDAIDEFGGYNHTPDVSSEWLGISNLTEDQLPVIYVWPEVETREPLLGPAADCSFNIRLMFAVWAAARADLRGSINRLVRDIEKAVEADVTSTRLGLEWVHAVDIREIKISPDYIIDDHKAYGTMLLTVTYRHTMNEA